MDVVTLPFVIGSTPPTDSDPYLFPRPNGNDEPLPNYIPAPKGSKKISRPDKSKLFYHINRLTNIQLLCILSSIAPDILAIVYDEGHLGFSRCYKVIAHSWFISGFIKLFRSFIYHCCQCLALQTRQHLSYRSLQLIELPPIPFFILTLDFVLALPLSKEGFNAIMSVTCKFSKQVTLVEDANTWSAE